MSTLSPVFSLTEALNVLENKEGDLGGYIRLRDLNGMRPGSGLERQRQKPSGVGMSQDDLALLRALAARPITNVSPTSHPRLAALVQEGYVACTADGWLATALGCSVLEERRWFPPR